ncbi:6,7-dimethyl-8-ribityllumazine synthase [Flavobacteriales bacterium]|nr:6,7-dimethyl-8-ribityllumazine synthase [Flavobacteriales bacterium]
MATIHKNLSDFDPSQVPSGEGKKIALVVAEWNDDITFNLAKGAEELLISQGVAKSDISKHTVPGTFELPLAAKWVLEKGEVDAVICCGCVIQGETRHFDFVCDGVTQGITQLNLDFGVPVIFCVLTDNVKQQSLDRSGGIHGNKGTEAGVAALKMIDLKNQI